MHTAFPSGCSLCGSKDQWRAGVKARSPHSIGPNWNKVMGASRDDFVKYPRTPHLFGSRGTDDDKHLGQRESAEFIAESSLIVEEKLDGTNVGIHFTTAGRRTSARPSHCRGRASTVCWK